MITCAILIESLLTCEMIFFDLIKSKISEVFPPEPGADMWPAVELWTGRLRSADTYDWINDLELTWLLTYRYSTGLGGYYSNFRNIPSQHFTSPCENVDFLLVLLYSVKYFLQKSYTHIRHIEAYTAARMTVTKLTRNIS